MVGYAVLELRHACRYDFPPAVFFPGSEWYETLKLSSAVTEVCKRERESQLIRVVICHQSGVETAHPGITVTSRGNEKMRNSCTYNWTWRRLEVVRALSRCLRQWSEHNRRFDSHAYGISLMILKRLMLNARWHEQKQRKKRFWNC